MKEIKFRAWDEPHRCYFPNDSFCVLNPNEYGAIGRMITDWDNYTDGEYLYPKTQIIEQFTGLHDRNGKEIYEGDVIAGGKKGEHCVVTFCTNIGRWVAFGKSYTVYPSRFYLFEVIGNIHEYPHLMEGGKQ